MRFLLAFLAVPLWGLSNSVVVYEAGGAAQTDRPLTISRFFAKGEFPSGTYPRPYSGGAALGVYQVDVKTTWPDGSVQHAFISTRLSLPANGSVTVDFRQAGVRCHLVNDAACEAAALSGSGILNSVSGTWGAGVRGTLNSIAYSADARTMIAAGNFTYWLKGPVVTQVIAEDLSTSLAYDFGWQYTSAWEAPSSDIYKSLHPAFDVAVWPAVGSCSGWPGAWVQARLYNGSLSRLQKIPLDKLETLTGNPATTAWSACTSGCTVTVQPIMRGYAAFRWDGWSGTTPGSVVIDFNLPYMIHSRLIPQYDLGLSPTSTYADGFLNTYNTYSTPHIEFCSSSVRCGNVYKGMGTTGGRSDIAFIPGWTLAYLMIMGQSGVTTANKLDAYQKLIVGDADAAA
jgi:hypothetical protein